MKQFAQAEHLAGVVSFLVGPDARYMTGNLPENKSDNAFAGDSPCFLQVIKKLLIRQNILAPLIVLKHPDIFC